MSGGEDKWKEPAKGQAEALLNTDVAYGADRSAARTAASLAFGDSPNGLAIGPDGKFYGTSAALSVIEDDHKARAILNSEVHGTNGLVVLSPDSFLVGKGGQVLRLQADKNQTVLAGASGKPRELGEPVPAAAAAAEFHFSNYTPEVFGTRPDGTILIAEGDVLWQLNNGRLTRLYQVPRTTDAAGKTRLMHIGVGSAVDHSGTVYASASAENENAGLSDVVAIHRDGSVGQLTFPKRVAGVQTDLAAFEVNWMTGDGGDGVYVRGADKAGEYVLHVASGEATLVAKFPYEGPHAGCKEGYLVDAMKLPCRLPWAVTYSSGNLYLMGNSDFVLKIATK
ncbi:MULTISPECIES: hypothetical protein [unclassified Streptomyces]|uniref:hypothetical protein n=1 Tax=unclassified Streptomyces TaxID=2593676 RepID=UPI0037F464E2